MNKIILAAAFAVLATPAVAAEQTFSAIALSPDSGAYGEGHDWPSMSQAKNKAMYYCRQNADDPRDCRVVTWSKGQYCAAVAITNMRGGGVTWGSGSGPTLRAAKQVAYDSCANQLGEDCEKILVSVCSH
jgi:hypothetical protein